MATAEVGMSIHDIAIGIGLILAAAAVLMACHVGAGILVIHQLTGWWPWHGDQEERDK
jgi:hypothetical protein